jgi:hypothetical protein
MAPQSIALSVPVPVSAEHHDQEDYLWGV